MQPGNISVAGAIAEEQYRVKIYLNLFALCPSDDFASTLSLAIIIDAWF